MAGLIIGMMGALLLASGLAWKLWRLRQEVYDFADRLDMRLDEIISGKTLEEEDEENLQDSLWGKVYEKLSRVEHIWKQKEEQTQREKQMLKEFISDISHQTRTPMANLKIYTEFLKEEPLSEKGKGFLMDMEGQTGKLDFLLQSMVKVSRLETGLIRIRSRKTQVLETLGKAVAAIVPKAEKKEISLSVDCDKGAVLWYDRKWTEEAIFNLLDNAVKYTEPGGQIHIRVMVGEIFTRISVQDTGKGIATERQAEIFARFYREPEVHEQEGIGIGLYLARKIIELQKGYIEVRSQMGEGSDFSIYLPNEILVSKNRTGKEI